MTEAKEIRKLLEGLSGQAGWISKDGKNEMVEDHLDWLIDVGYTTSKIAVEYIDEPYIKAIKDGHVRWRREGTMFQIEGKISQIKRFKNILSQFIQHGDRVMILDDKYRPTKGEHQPQFVSPAYFGVRE